MNFINLTPHEIVVYKENQFVNLEQTGPTIWIADGVSTDPYRVYPSQGVARISAGSEQDATIDGIPIVKSYYGELEGISPELLEQKGFLIVSTLCLSMATQANNKLASRMMSPYKVVRDRKNGSLVLGCVGFSRQ